MKALKFCCLLLAACGNLERKQDIPISQKEERQFNFGSLTDSGIKLFDFGSNSNTHVNLPLWRASLDVLNFTPIAVSDPVGGIITTEWYSPNEQHNRYKVSVRITSQQLKPDAISVSIFKETQKNTKWIVCEKSKSKETELEKLIFNRAKELNGKK